jgi:type IV pilus assembly protein PilV
MNNSQPQVFRPRSQRGFSMIEALVAMVVLAIGMLGVAGLYVITLQSGKSAISRLHAVNLASDLADRIRANRTAQVAYAGAAADNGCVGGATICNSVLMAADDLFWWQAQVAAKLPGNPTTNVGVVVGTPTTYTITITWQEPGEAAPLSYAMAVQI